MYRFPRTIISHRGGGILAPENTVAAMQTCLANAFHAVEFDVMLTKDQIPILMHDHELGRTVPGNGLISQYDWEQLKHMDVGSWLNTQYSSERIPSYEDIVHFCGTHDIWMNVEIKPEPGFENITGYVVGKLTRELFDDSVEKYNITNNTSVLPLFSSFSAEALMSAKKIAPEIPRGWLVEVLPLDWKQVMVDLGAVALHVDHTILTKAIAEEIKSLNYALMCYTVNDVERAEELRSWGVDAICTDRIDLFKEENY